MKSSLYLILVLLVLPAILLGQDAKNEDYRKLFKGTVTAADERTRFVELRYDFSKPAQLKDFAGIPLTGGARLHPGGMATPSWLKAQFDGDISVGAHIVARGGMCAVLVMVDPVELEGYVFLFGLNDRAHGGRSFAGVALYRQGHEPRIIYRGVLGTWNPGDHTISVLRKGDLLQFTLDKRIVVKTWDSTHRSGKIGFAGDFLVDRLTVKGRLNERWCEKALGSRKEPRKRTMSPTIWEYPRGGVSRSRFLSGTRALKREPNTM